jgi:5-hydroxyisourate hydrolase
MITLSTHVLDTALGEPARGVRVALEQDGRILGTSLTDGDGRVRRLAEDATLGSGVYRLIVHVGEYFRDGGRETFWTSIVVEFRVDEADAHYHVPILLSPYGYSTYRGS